MSSRARRKDAGPPKDEVENSLLARLIEEQQQQSADEQFTGDIAVLFCGMKRSGKTSLVDRFINPKKDEKDVPKPTVALDYKYARREASDASASKVLAHIYDLGGDEGNENLVQIPVSPATVGNLVVCLTLDLSEPWAVLPALEKWTQLLRGQVAKSLEALAKESANGAARVEALQKARKEALEQNPDQANVNALPCPLAIFCTKWDVLVGDSDPEKRKALCRALRYFAHVNGASLLFSSLKEKDAMNNVRGILRKLVFGVEVKGGVPEQLDPSKPICVTAGKDSLEKIGKPHGSQALDKAWRDLVKTYFPDPQTSQSKDTAAQKVEDELKKYQESSIDGMVAQRILELDLYRRQVERNQRLASEGVDGNKLGALTT
mmetsp:Transcript_84614/g.274121  ORF Transcript_84614/g.274121 Transcript_84614/m.274121 type:complete len:377 (-) Transcript_84614:160-1290(-)